MNITRTIKCTVPAGMNYSNTEHFLSISRQIEEEDLLSAENEVVKIDEYLGYKAKDYFSKYLDFMKTRGADSHRITLKEGIRYPHVTDILSLEYPAPAIANLDEYGKLGSACDRLWKTFKRENKWIPEDFKDSGLIKTTYKQIFDKSVEWFGKFGKDITFTEDSGECISKDFNYIGEYDLLGTYDGLRTLFDVKSTKDLSGKILTKYLCQLAAYSKTLEGIDQICIISPFDEPKVEGNIDLYFGKFLMIRGKYQERYGI